MGFNSNENRNVVQTALDDIFMQEFKPLMHPGSIDATNGQVFVQDSTDRAAIIEEVFKGTGLWGEREEEADVKMSKPSVANQITSYIKNYADSVDISKNLFDDNLHGTYEKMVRNFAQMAKATQDTNAFAVYRNAFTTALTADGATLVSDTHTTLSGVNVDNKLTAALTPDSLFSAVVALSEQKNQAGVIMGGLATTLLVPPALFKKACEICGSELLANTTDNNINVFSSKYGINIVTSNRLGAAAGGSDTAWFLMTGDHSVRRYVRQGIMTDLVDYKFQRNNNYIYKGEFRETVQAVDYAGIVGSLGTN